MADFGQLLSQIGHRAEGQYGYVSRSQLLAAGLGAREIARWCDRGVLIRVHHGVYAVGHRRIEAVALAAAALLACGPDAVVSHETAAALWGIRKRWPRVPEVSSRSRHSRGGIRHHRTQTLTGKDIRRHRGLKVTSPARTLLDIKPRLTAKQFTRAVNDARLARLLTLERAAEMTGAAGNATRSGFEDAVRAAIRARGLPEPEINVPLHGFEVDMYFREQATVVEIDDYRYHADPGAFERERRESEVMAAARLALIRISDERWDADAEGVLDNLEQTLGNRGLEVEQALGNRGLEVEQALENRGLAA